MKKPIIIAIAITTTILIYKLMKAKTFGKITLDQKIRGCDSWGCGHFGADRAGHTHQGIDIVTTVNQSIYSPISGVVTRFPFPYGDDLNYTGIEIKNDDYSVKIFYLAPTVPIGKSVKAGDTIGIAQNIAKKYSAKMTNHVHLEVRQNNKIINPAILY